MKRERQHIEMTLSKAMEEIQAKEREASQSRYQAQSLHQEMLAEQAQQKKEKEDLQQAALQKLQELSVQMEAKIADDRASMQQH
eukprot:11911768-Prorocentrum_lima.AAC.1